MIYLFFCEIQIRILNFTKLDLLLIIKSAVKIKEFAIILYMDEIKFKNNTRAITFHATPKFKPKAVEMFVEIILKN